jgi:hypothetical protein
MSDEQSGQYGGDGYRHVLELAWDQLLSCDPKGVARDARARLDGGRMALPFLGREALVDLRSRTMTIDGKSASVAEGILALHYLAGTRSASPTGEWISFRQLPGGHAYFGAFKRRTIDGIAALFQRRPVSLVAAARGLGGSELSIGDASVRLDVFPKVPVAVVVWAGDDEIDGSANVLFDETAPMHLPVEDLAVIGAIVHDALSDAVRRSS